jgi:hypothetical protein
VVFMPEIDPRTMVHMNAPCIQPSGSRSAIHQMVVRLSVSAYLAVLRCLKARVRQSSSHRRIGCEHGRGGWGLAEGHDAKLASWYK